MTQLFENGDLVFKDIDGTIPPLPEALSARTWARARAHFEAVQRIPASPFFAEIPVPSRLVPALLASAAAVFAIDTCMHLMRLFG